MPTRTQGIRQTLLRHLLLRPQPINRDAYKRSFLRLFPGVEEFQLFLEAESTEAQVSMAKRLLLRLVHHHHFPPPKSLVLNLLEFERRRQGSERAKIGGYVGQDHFVHLINLYLLGIFLFSYHPEIHSRCSQQLNSFRLRFRERKQAEVDPGIDVTVAANSYDVFALTWTYFVLYHDLAYPIEALRPSERATDANKPILDRFQHIFSASVEQLAFKALSNLLVSYSSIQSGKATTLGAMYLSYSSRLFLHKECLSSLEGRSWLKPYDGSSELEVDREEILNKWSSASHIPQLRGYTLKATLSIIPDENLSAVLVDESTGDPLLTVFFKISAEDQEESAAGKPFLIWLDEKRKRPKGLTNVDLPTIVDSAFGSQRPLGRYWAWHYFGKGSTEHFQELLVKLFGDAAPSFELLAQKVPSIFGISPDSFKSEGAAGQTSFEIFWQIGDNFTKDKSIRGERRPSIEEVMDRVENSLLSISNEMPIILGHETDEFFEGERLNGSINFRDLLLGKDLKKALHAIVGHLLSQRSKLEGSLYKKLDKRIQDLLDVEEAKSTLKESIFSGILEALPEPLEQAYGFNGKSIDGDFSLPKILELKDPILTRISKRLESLQLPNLQELASSYCPRYVAEEGSGYDPKRFVDHGLGGALVSISLGHLFSTLASILQEGNFKEDPGRGVVFLRLAFITQSATATYLLDFERQELLEEAMLAVALHNLYPEAIPGGREHGYKTSIGTEPFAFLCMLADGLQRWDRERQANQGLGLLGPAVYGSRFDMEIRGETLILSVWGAGTDLDSEKRNLRDVLNNYLLDISKIIKLRLSEV